MRLPRTPSRARIAWWITEVIMLVIILALVKLFIWLTSFRFAVTVLIVMILLMKVMEGKESWD